MTARPLAARGRQALSALLIMSLAWGLWGGCAIRMSWPRHEVYVVATARGQDATRWASMTRLALVYDAVELISCQDHEAPPTLPGFGATMKTALKTARQAALKTREARAHGPSTPTRQGVPHIIDWASGARDARVTLARFEPPPGEYCAVRVDFGPADDDAVGLEAAQELLDGTLLARRAHAADGWRAARTSARADARFVFPTPWVFPEEGDVNATLVLELDLEAALVNPSLWEADDEEDAGRRLLALTAQELSLIREQTSP